MKIITIHITYYEFTRKDMKMKYINTKIIKYFAGDCPLFRFFVARSDLAI